MDNRNPARPALAGAALAEAAEQAGGRIAGWVTDFVKSGLLLQLSLCLLPAPHACFLVHVSHSSNPKHMTCPAMASYCKTYVTRHWRRQCGACPDYFQLPLHGFVSRAGALQQAVQQLPGAVAAQSRFPRPPPDIKNLFSHSPRSVHSAGTSMVANAGESASMSYQQRGYMLPAL